MNCLSVVYGQRDDRSVYVPKLGDGRLLPRLGGLYQDFSGVQLQDRMN